MNGMEKILREILAEDKTILSRRDDLLAALEKKVPDNLRRDYAPIKRAINLNVGEIFFVGESDKDATKTKVADILKSSGMQEARINFVIETFTKALEQIKIPEVVEETVAKSKINTVKADTKKISLDKPEELPKIFEPKKTVEDIVEETTQYFDNSQTQTPPPEKNIIEETSRNFDNLQSQNASQTLQDAPPFLPQNHKSKIFTTEGRLNRWAYFVQSLKICGLLILGIMTSGILIGIPILIAAIVGGIMVNIRRLHDLNKSGGWLLISFIPYVDIVFSLYLLFAKGTDGYNKYGPDPLRE